MLPELNGQARRLRRPRPGPDGSVVDLTFATERDDDASRRSTRRVKAAADGPVKGILAYTEDPIVSIDIVSDPHSSIFDARSRWSWTARS